MQTKERNKRTSKILRNRGISIFLVLLLCLNLMGCSEKKKEADNGKESVSVTATEEATAETTLESVEATVFTENGEEFTTTNEYVYTTTKLNVRENCSTDSSVVKMLPERAKVLRVAVGDNWSKISLNEGEYYVATEYLTTEEPKLTGTLIAIDAGHQEKGNSEQEAIGPGATETKAKVSSGTRGVTTGVNEYELNLRVALQLKEELISRGYEVFMVRESNDIDLSNRQRAEMAAEAGAAALIRIHANGSEVKSTHGAMTICGTKDNPYVADMYDENYRLSKDILTHFVKQTGAESKGVWETDIMSGINWSTIPVTILEMGYMSNSEEDQKMSDPEYQKKMVRGIADGIDTYFE